MRPPAPAGGPTQTSYILTDHCGSTSPKLTLLVALLPCADGKVFRENRCQQLVVRVVPGLVPSTLGPHHPPSSDRPHVVSRHLPRLLATNLHDLVPSMRFQSPNPKAPLDGNTDRLCTSTMTWTHRKILRVPYPTAAKDDIGHVLMQRILRKHPRGVQNRAFPPDASKSPEKDPPREPTAVVQAR